VRDRESVTYLPAVKIFAKIKPGSKNESVRKIDAAHFEIHVKAPAREGKANAAAISALARHLNVPKSKIKLLAGAKSKQKVFGVL
jgi:uncharacterized protein YggU (UPF0235/DUF167 family)